MKVETQHTPGPWRYHVGRGSKLKFHIQTEGGFQIASTPDDEQHCEANAQLLSAAPALLEACKEALELIRIARQYFPKSMHDSDKFKLENTCATVGSAIHKATPC